MLNIAESNSADPPSAITALCTSERIRGSRIVLSQITHLPYAAAIWAYEYACQYMRSREGSGRSNNLPQMLKKGAVMPGGLNLSRKQWISAPTSRSESSVIRGPIAEIRSKGEDELLELKQMISRLNTKVDELTTRLDRQLSGYN